MAWPQAGSEPGSLGINWAGDVEGAKSLLENTAPFKAPAGMFLPVLMDLYNGEAVCLEPQDTMGQARDVACEPLKGEVIVPKVGPRTGVPQWTSAIMLRALVVDDKQQIVFDLDSRI